MSALSSSTEQRLKKIPQIPSVWEGDRRPLSGLRGVEEDEIDSKGDCILWVDGSEGFVRSMDIVSPQMGIEAVVRTLLRAIETPHSPAKPARPQKIVVRNREIQFFLRGALQSLDINIDYVPELPLIDELFRSFESMSKSKPPAIPSFYEPLLKQTSVALWDVAPWNLLADHDIIAIELEDLETPPIYACIMGMLGQEYGVILYRSLDSLNQFRQAILSEKSADQLETVFLSQDCWFLNYKALDEDEFDDEILDLEDLPSDEVEALFGSIHPLEGIRPFLDEDEAQIIYYALQAFIRFIVDHPKQLAQDPVTAARKRYQISSVTESGKKAKVAATVYTMPDLTQSFLDMMAEEEEDEDEEDDFELNSDFVPDKAFLSLGMIPWESITLLRSQPKTEYPIKEAPQKGDGLPAIVIQTTRPKAKEMIDILRSEGGIKGICFNPGEDPWSDDEYDLGIIQTEASKLHLFGEFLADDAVHKKARQKWNTRCQQTQGYCSVIIAMGVTGSSRGKPKPTDILAVFETQFLDAKDLNIGTLRLTIPWED
ncbi:MAG: hypothetical protein VKJ02_17185 [Snowella sp.]|nr:hypothetical protein [Snowella sp.]